MSEHVDQGTNGSSNTVEVTVEREAVTRLVVGSRWEVVASSLESLWHGPYTVTLRQVEDGDGAKEPR